jgi:hypothetical protein
MTGILIVDDDAAVRPPSCRLASIDVRDTLPDLRDGDDCWSTACAEVPPSATGAGSTNQASVVLPIAAAPTVG